MINIFRRQKRKKRERKRGDIIIQFTYQPFGIGTIQKRIPEHTNRHKHTQRYSYNVQPYRTYIIHNSKKDYVSRLALLLTICANNENLIENYVKLITDSNLSCWPTDVYAEANTDGQTSNGRRED